MSDSKLRELERRWRETGRLEDQNAFMREAVRTGHLAGERLLLAALLRSSPTGAYIMDLEAELAAVRDRMYIRRSARMPAGFRFGNTGQRPPGDEDDLVNTFVECGWETCVRAGLAISRRAVVRWEQQFLGLAAEIAHQTWDPAGQEYACDLGAPRRLWESVRLTITGGSEAQGVREATQSVREAMSGVNQAHERFVARLPGPLAHREEITGCLAQLELVLGPATLVAHRDALPEGQAEALRKSVITSVLQTGATALGQGQSQNGPQLEVNPSTGAESMFLSLEEELVPWLLGLDDPLAPLAPAGASP